MRLVLPICLPRTCYMQAEQTFETEKFNNVIYFFLNAFPAYKVVLHSYGLNSNQASDEEENSDIELMEVNNLPYL